MIWKVKVLWLGKSRLHNDVASLHRLTNVPTMYELPQDYQRITQLDDMAKNNTGTGFKSHRVNTSGNVKWSNCTDLQNDFAVVLTTFHFYH